jgi:pimeloyl-ACP methyl ester carboxylesterase
VSLIAEGIGSSIDPVGAALAFYGDADEEDKRLALSSLASEPYWPARTPLELTDERFGSVRRFYVECTEDKAVWLDHQREMHTALPVEHVETLRSGHSPFLTQPDDLVDALLRILDRAEASPPSIERRG